MGSPKNKNKRRATHSKRKQQHRIKPVPKSITGSTHRSNVTKKNRHKLEKEIGKELGDQDYHDINTGVQNMLIIHETSLKYVENQGIGPEHEGLTRMLSWEKKGSKHFYRWLRSKTNAGNLTKYSRKKKNKTQGECNQ